jgi:hypothetical protein
MKRQIFVMPAWIAGIQGRRMRPENIHVNLDSSTPCRNHGIEVLRELIKAFRPVFSKEKPAINADQAFPSSLLPLNFKSGPTNHG